MADIDLGFPEERDVSWLTNRYFPSKVGGNPAWLELNTLPSKEDLQCEICRMPMAFLCQIYAPFDEEYNFHRSIFVFVCRNADCQQANSTRNFTVLRSQLPKQNDFYSEEPPEESGNSLPSIPTGPKLCHLCGCGGLLMCSRCKKANYCSAQHQKAHWPHHKKTCTTETTENGIKSGAAVPIPEIHFPEREIVVESNDNEESKNVSESDDDDDDAEEISRLKDFENLAAAGKTGALNNVADSELQKYADSSDDRQFRIFKEEVKKEPDQILRYKRNGQPLWITATKLTVEELLKSIPNCELCGRARQFEFQIMPQLLLLLKDENLDWGVLVVYSCPGSCELPTGVGYTREHIVKQDIVK